jgi:hypothetical protein
MPDSATVMALANAHSVLEGAGELQWFQFYPVQQNIVFGQLRK